MKHQNNKSQNNISSTSQHLSDNEREILTRIERIEKKLDQSLENTEKSAYETHQDLLIDANQEDALSQVHKENQTITKQLHEENQGVIKQVHKENQQVTQQLHNESQKLSQEMHKQSIRTNWLALTISIIISIVISVTTVYIFFRDNFISSV